jgi:hypothetical protein
MLSLIVFLAAPSRAHLGRDNWDNCSMFHPIVHVSVYPYLGYEVQVEVRSQRMVGAGIIWNNSGGAA